jgi:hypothetical protein
MWSRAYLQRHHALALPEDVSALRRTLGVDLPGTKKSGGSPRRGSAIRLMEGTSQTTDCCFDPTESMTPTRHQWQTLSDRGGGDRPAYHLSGAYWRGQRRA